MTPPSFTWYDDKKINHICAMDNDLTCCVDACEVELNQQYWDNQYITNQTGWDLGEVSPAIKQFIHSLTNKNLKILIPGCGRAYEAEYLISQGFLHITILDISPTLVHSLQNKFAKYPQITVVLGDFFNHHDSYDVIIEQTFFCALPPYLRVAYAYKMYSLLQANGTLFGLFFNRQFEKSPPFGGSELEYKQLFGSLFTIETCQPSVLSAKPRQQTELEIKAVKNKHVHVQLYSFNGVTCNGCKNTVTQKLAELPNVVQAIMSTHYKQVMIVSTQPISTEQLSYTIAYESTYTIEPLKTLSI